MPKIITAPTKEQQRLIDEVKNTRLRIEQAKKDYEEALTAVVASGVSLTQLQRYVGISKQALSRQIKRLQDK